MNKNEVAVGNNGTDSNYNMGDVGKIICVHKFDTFMFSWYLYNERGDHMKLASIREFRSSLADYGKDGEMVLVTNHGKMVGCFLPLEKSGNLPIEMKKEFVAQMGRSIASSLSLRKITEKDILDDFKAFKKHRR